MSRLFTAATLIAAACITQGCAGTSKVKNQDMADSPSRAYTATKAQVVVATQSTIEDLGYKLTDTREADPTTQLYFNKSSFMGKGEAGRVDITGLTAGTKVSVGTTAKSSKMQITGTTQNEFAKAIFSGLDKQLATPAQ